MRQACTHASQHAARSGALALAPTPALALARARAPSPSWCHAAITKHQQLRGSHPPCPSLQATYPLDALRLRLAVDPAAGSIAQAAAIIWREGGVKAFYKGLGPSLAGGGGGAAGGLMTSAMHACYLGPSPAGGGMSLMCNA